MSYSVPSMGNPTIRPAIKVCNTCQNNGDISFIIPIRFLLPINKSNNILKIQKETDIDQFLKQQSNFYPSLFATPCNIYSYSIQCCIYISINACFRIIMRAFSKGYNRRRRTSSSHAVT